MPMGCGFVIPPTAGTGGSARTELLPALFERREHLIDALLEDGPVFLALRAGGRREKDPGFGKAGLEFVHECAGFARENVGGELIELAVLEPATQAAERREQPGPVAINR